MTSHKLGVASATVTGPGLPHVEDIDPVDPDLGGPPGRIPFPTFPGGLTPTRLPQRGARPARPAVELVGGRPMLAVPYAIRSTSSVTFGAPDITEQLLDEALSVDLDVGGHGPPTMRFLPDPAKLIFATQRWYPSVGPIYGPKAMYIFLGFTSDANPPAIESPAYPYESRLGPLARPVFALAQQPIAFWPSGVVSPVQLINSFTFAIVAAFHGSPNWSFTDVVSTYQPGDVQPEDAKACTLRWEEDRLRVYSGKRRCTSMTVNEWGPRSPEVIRNGQADELPRPAILIWSMDYPSRVGSLVVTTPRRTHHQEFRIPDQLLFGPPDNPADAPWKEPFGLGMPMDDGTYNAVNFGDTSSPFWGGLANWDLFDVSYWDNAATVHEAREIATQLDSVYGVAS